MADAPTLSPAVARSVLAVARTLVAAARSWALYPPEHPVVRSSLDRLPTAIRGANGEQIIGTLVRRKTDAIGVVTHEPPSDPFRPQVKVVRDRDGRLLEESILVNTWEPDGRGDFTWAVVEAVDPEAVDIDPLKYM
jgi:hypothetical protein